MTTNTVLAFNSGICFSCQKPQAPKKCAPCLEVYKRYIWYCNADCQKKNWHTHKTDCAVKVQKYLKELTQPLIRDQNKPLADKAFTQDEQFKHLDRCTDEGSLEKLYHAGFNINAEGEEDCDTPLFSFIGKKHPFTDKDYSYMSKLLQLGADPFGGWHLSEIIFTNCFKQSPDVEKYAAVIQPKMIELIEAAQKRGTSEPEKSGRINTMLPMELLQKIFINVNKDNEEENFQNIYTVCKLWNLYRPKPPLKYIVYGHDHGCCGTKLKIHIQALKNGQPIPIPCLDARSSLLALNEKTVVQIMLTKEGTLSSFECDRELAYFCSELVSGNVVDQTIELAQQIQDSTIFNLVMIELAWKCTCMHRYEEASRALQQLKTTTKALS